MAWYGVPSLGLEVTTLKGMHFFMFIAPLAITAPILNANGNHD
jgi:hypothetical protein